MISFTVRMRFDDSDRDTIKATLEALTIASRQEPGCVTYISHFVEDDPSTVLIYEQYTDKAALDAHRETPHFKQHAIGGLFQRMRDRKIEDLVAIA